MAAPSGLVLVPLILSLSLDTFAVSMAIGIAPMAHGLRLRFAAACALAEAVMPLVGFVAGGLVGRLGVVADWVSVALLLGAGLWIVREALEGDDEIVEALERAQQGGRALLVVALSVSLDELAVGLAFGTLRLPIVPVLIAIAAQAVVVSLLGLRLGAALGARAGARATLLAGLVLCLVAVGVGVTNVVGR
ncbi:MAG TPA: manganese efflux pump [Chloroflexota bacterium]|nr:manganese efflux pump [Chloroflexota bacterium]